MTSLRFLILMRILILNSGLLSAITYAEETGVSLLLTQQEYIYSLSTIASIN
jgi:hypothetical protein